MENHHQLLVDCGDFGYTTGKAQTLKVEYLLKGMGLLEYDAINLAEKDLQYGREFLERMRDQYDLPFVSANVYQAGTDKLFAKSHIIKKIGGVKFGIFGIMNTKGISRMVTPKTGFEVKDPLTAAKKAVKELRKKCDVVIALAHMSLNGSRDLAKQVQGIDFIISGHGGSHIRQPEKIGETVIMQPGSQGKYLGQLDFVVTGETVSQVRGKTVDLSDKIKDEANLAKVIKEYEEALLATYPLQSPKAQTKFSRYSERSCAACHRKQDHQWRTTLHAKAWETLVREKQNHNPECQQCHTTMNGETNGFTSIRETPDLVNVQCSQCHRFNGDNILTHINRRRNAAKSSNGKTNGQNASDFQPVSEQICLKCHTEDNSPDFNYDSYKTKITH